MNEYQPRYWLQPNAWAARSRAGENCRSYEALAVTTGRGKPENLLEENSASPRAFTPHISGLLLPVRGVAA